MIDFKLYYSNIVEIIKSQLIKFSEIIQFIKSDAKVKNRLQINWDNIR